MVSEGKVVLVHCIQGISRSVSIVIAYLMVFRRMSLRAAYDLVRSQRPRAHPNPGFILQLLTLEQQTFGHTTLSPEEVWCKCLYPPQRSATCTCALRRREAGSTREG